MNEQTKVDKIEAARAKLADTEATRRAIDDQMKLARNTLDAKTHTEAAEMSRAEIAAAIEIAGGKPLAKSASKAALTKALADARLATIGQTDSYRTLQRSQRGLFAYALTIQEMFEIVDEYEPIRLQMSLKIAAGALDHFDGTALSRLVAHQTQAEIAERVVAAYGMDRPVGEEMTLPEILRYTIDELIKQNQFGIERWGSAGQWFSIAVFEARSQMAFALTEKLERFDNDERG